jgi:hypothetical protein
VAERADPTVAKVAAALRVRYTLYTRAGQTVGGYAARCS